MAVIGRRQFIELCRALVAIALSPTLAAASMPHAPTAPAIALSEHLRAGTGACEGLLEFEDDHGHSHDGSCTHGPDYLTDPVEVGSSALDLGGGGRPAIVKRGMSAVGPGAAAPAGAAGVEPDLPGIPCYTTGSFVKVFYLYHAGRPNLLGERLPHIREIVAVADAIYALSARQTNGTRHVRWKMTADCRLAVRAVGIDMRLSLTSARYLLMRKGLLRSTEKAIAFRETGSFCYGLGQLFRDDRANPRTNRNNKGGMLSWLQLGPCLEANAGHLRMGEMTAHEIAHTLGAVQWTTPNSSKHGHCVDTYDTMCYKDAPTTRLKQVCPLSRPLLFDCRKNDYFHTAPRAGSYLARHWNIARNAFLARGEPVAWDRLERPAVSIMSPPPGGTVAGTFSIDAAATAPAGAIIAGVAFFVGDWQVDYDTTAPYSISIDTIGSFANGTQLRIAAGVVDNFDRVGWASDAVVTVDNPPASVALIQPVSGASVSGVLTLEASAAPAPGTSLQSVDFLVNGQIVGSAFMAPYATQIDTLGLGADGSTIVITAQALDNYGRLFTSAPVSVTLSNPPPSVSIVTPANGAVVTGPFEVSASASVGPGAHITSVAFSLDGFWVGEAVAAPWSTIVDPALFGYEPGATFALTATATDDRFREATSAPVSVTYQP